MKLRSLSGLFGIAALAVVASPLLAADLLIYPSPALIGLDGPCRSSASAAVNSSIDCALVEALTEQEGAGAQAVRELITQSAKEAFGQRVTPRITREQRNRAYVLSVEIVRASRYVVPKGGVAELLLPLTVGLKVTNILSGEVIYATSLTEVQPLRVPSEDQDNEATRQQVREQYRQLAVSVVQNLIRKAGAGFQPGMVETQALRRWQGYTVLDAGLDRGIGLNDELIGDDGSQLRVVQADARYAVAVPILPQEPANGTRLVKISLNTAAVRKPKVLIAQVTVPNGQAPAYVEQLFADAVGERAAFTVMPVNPRFAALQQAVSQDSDLAQEDITQRRPLPSLFIRLMVSEPQVARVRSDNGVREKLTIVTRVMGELLDEKGQVRFAATYTDRREDDITAGMGLDVTAQQEVGLKNALVGLGQRFVEGVRFASRTLTVESVGSDEIRLGDDMGWLAAGDSIRVFRPTRIDGLVEEVLIPLWDATITGRAERAALAQAVLPIIGSAETTPRLRQGDKVLIETPNSSPVSGALALCPSDSAPSQALGTVRMSGYEALAHYSLGAQAKRPVYVGHYASADVPRLAAAVAQLGRDGGFRQALNPQFEAPVQACLQPVHKIDLVAENCRPDTPSCELTYTVVAGFRQLDEKGQRVGSLALSQDVTLKDLPATDREGVVRVRLEQSLEQLLGDVLKNPVFH